MNTIKVYSESAGQGCLTNLLETTTVRDSLDGQYQSCTSALEADVILISTCGYSQSAEKNSLDVIKKYELKYPGKKVIATGCLPRINAASLKGVAAAGDIKQLREHVTLKAKIEEPNLSFSSEINHLDLSQRRLLNRLGDWLSPILLKLNRRFGWPSQMLINIFESVAFDQKTYAVGVSTGCLGKCTYCAIKKAKGSLVSRDLAEIIPRLQEAVDSGYERIHLLADDVGCWGEDIGLNSAVLLKEIFKIKGDFKLVIDYFDPTWLVKHFAELKEPLADRRMICINVPIQSGNNRVLQEMSRNYDITKVMDCLQQMKNANRNLAIKTHIMTGYPGEKNSEFFDSLKKLNYFDLAFPNSYSARPGTPAAKLVANPRWNTWLRFQLLSICIHFLHFKRFVGSFLVLKARS